MFFGNNLQAGALEFIEAAASTEESGWQQQLPSLENPLPPS
jgi:hypothetical protein